MSREELIEQYCRLYSPRFSLDVEVTVDNRRRPAEQDLTERLLTNQGQLDHAQIIRRWRERA
jgi:3-oxoacyl-ACP reductase-like protein